MIEILIGMISGIVSGTGMGGGTILIFLLTSRICKSFIDERLKFLKLYVCRLYVSAFIVRACLWFVRHDVIFDIIFQEKIANLSLARDIYIMH